MDERLKSKLQKLQNLAERGVGGEKETAKKKLDQILASNGMSEADLKEDTESYYLFSYTFPYKQKLLSQIIYKVTGKSDLYKSRGTRNKLGTYCTAAQKLEIELDFEFYSNLLDEEIDMLLSAFIAKQEIFPEDTPTEVVSFSEMSEDEVARHMKIINFAQSIDYSTRKDLIETDDTVD